MRPCRKAKGGPKKHVEKKPVEKAVRGRSRKKPEAPVVPPLVPQATGISRSCFRRYTDYVVVSDTLEGLGVLGGGAATVGTSAGSKPTGRKKRKPEEKAADAGGKKRSRIQIKRRIDVSQAKPVVAAELQDFSFLFDAPHSPTHDAAADADAGRILGRRLRLRSLT
ncbi:hypothetical protein Hanom_Chr09g00792461 [Helianthus anomalus]